MTDNDEDCGRSRRSGAEHRGWPHMLGIWWLDYRKVGWRCVWYAPCIRRWWAWVSWLSIKTKVDGLSVIYPQNKWNDFSCLVLKPVAMVFSNLTLKSVATVSPSLALKPVASGFSVCASKSVVLDWWFRSQNHCDSFLVWSSKLSGIQFIGCTTKLMKGGQLASAGSKMRYGFPVWPQDWRRRDDKWCTWHRHRGYVEWKLKMNVSLRWGTSDSYTPKLSFLVY
jgi:hypothetical protein